MSDITRRECIALVGGAGLSFAVKVRRARAQQPAMPVIGALDNRPSHRWHTEAPEHFSSAYTHGKQTSIAK